MKKILVTTVPFGANNCLPLELLENAGVECVINPYNKKLTEDELFELVPEYDALIAGTEKITRRIMDNAPNLKLISRVGIGLDGVDLAAAREKGISVCYTPEAPAPAVAELTIGMILSLLRSIHLANRQVHDGVWQRRFGRRISEVTIGIIGLGRIGQRVIRRLGGFGTPRILVNDVNPDMNAIPQQKLEFVSKEVIYREADVISLHLPLTHLTDNMIGKTELLSMKKDALIVNTSRGGIINEQDLHDVLTSGHLEGAAIDVFEKEPYDGVLQKVENCLLTAHMGSMSYDCRARMEIEATQEIVRFFGGDSLASPVPETEYRMQASRAAK
ncbi:MAG: lactate dehydrogenase [Alteromonadaceae bacterium]|nr:MAG: lactate dehydrogenase [Alteromonadaceae bacterium]